ncbi:MAG: nickel-dependent lactate racemase [Anaerolineae bacterium]|nr:nickel-dependent lactate racemase [Anaerolineae bacterium]
MDHILRLPWGKDTLALTLPEDWSLVGEMTPQPLPAVADVTAETIRALENPYGMSRLAELAGAAAQIALVIDDDSRPTPVARLLPAVIAELERGGAGLERVTLIAALGVHRPMTDAEIARRVGEQVAPRLKIATHNPDDPAGLAELGITSRGTPVQISRVVAEADLVISIGCIEPHIIASFGGGYKNLVPGVAGRATIAHNHALNCQPATFNSVGQPIDRNPMRLDLEEAAAMIRPPVFVVNAVLNSALEVVRVVAGHPVAAHREGAQVSAAIYGVRIPRLTDVVITASHPMDQDLRQGVKALANTIRAVRRGGVLFTLVRAEEGVGVFGLANRRLPLGRRALRVLAPALLALLPRLKLKNMGEEDRFFLYFALQAMRHATLVLYAPTIPPEVRANLPFVQFVDSVEEGIALARSKLSRRAEVLVFPHGGSTYPILPE